MLKDRRSEIRPGCPARLEPDKEGRLVVHFPDLPEALTDGADEAEAPPAAADCLSETPTYLIPNSSKVVHLHEL